MSERGGGTQKSGEGKKPHINKPTSEKYKMYAIDKDEVKRRANCPRCGPSIFLAQHEGRTTCGKCKYTEFSIKK